MIKIKPSQIAVVVILFAVALAGLLLFGIFAQEIISAPSLTTYWIDGEGHSQFNDDWVNLGTTGDTAQVGDYTFEITRYDQYWTFNGCKSTIFWTHRSLPLVLYYVSPNSAQYHAWDGTKIVSTRTDDFGCEIVTYSYDKYCDYWLGTRSECTSGWTSGGTKTVGGADLSNSNGCSFSAKVYESGELIDEIGTIQKGVSNLTSSVTEEYGNVKVMFNAQNAYNYGECRWIMSQVNIDVPDIEYNISTPKSYYITGETALVEVDINNPSDIEYNAKVTARICQDTFYGTEACNDYVTSDILAPNSNTILEYSIPTAQVVDELTVYPFIEIGYPSDNTFNLNMNRQSVSEMEFIPLGEVSGKSYSFSIIPPEAEALERAEIEKEILEKELEEQSAYIDELSLSLDDKAKLIADLEIDNEQKQELIESLDLSEDDKEEIKSSVDYYERWGWFYDLWIIEWLMGIFS